MIYLFVGLMISASVFLWRLYAFGDLEPRGDHAFAAWWIKGLVSADHFLPNQEVGESLFDAMARDEAGILTQILRPIYNSPTELFKIISVLTVFTITKLIGDAYSIQLAISLIASAAIPFVLISFPFWRKATFNDTAYYWVGISALILAALSSYMHYFSGWGFHNYGILSLLFAVAVSTRVFTNITETTARQNNWRGFLILLIVNGISLYSYKTNLFLLPPATAIAILFLPKLNWQIKLKYLFIYSAIIFLLLLPFIPLVFISMNKPDYAQDMTSPVNLMFADLSGNLLEWPKIIYERTLNWFSIGQKLYSLPGLAAGTIGLIALARNGIILPFCIIFAHYLAWCFVPIFAGVAFRTYPYLIPFLALGAAYFIISAFKSTSNLPLNNKVLALIASGLLLAHISTQIPELRSKTHMKNSLPEFWASYYTGQGELRPVISEIEKILPTNATLLTWGYGLKFLYRDLKTNDLDVDLPALNALMLRQNVGLLKSHIKKRHLVFPSKAPIYILVDHEIDHINRQTLRLKVSALLGPNGFSISQNADIETIAMWQLKSSWPRNVTLYRVILKGP